MLAFGRAAFLAGRPLVQLARQVEQILGAGDRLTWSQRNSRRRVSHR